MEVEQRQKVGKKKSLLLVVFVVVLAVIIAAGVFFFMSSSKPEPEIISQSTLEKIINVSDLSTFEAVYNGIAKVANGDDPDEIDYYVSYDAKVKAGVDFEKVNISVDNENKVITVNVPEIKITDVNVDIASLDYIFFNDKANTATVSEEAYKKCIEDVKNESNNESAIYELAEQNARHIIEALISPFVEQLDAEYKLTID